MHTHIHTHAHARMHTHMYAHTHACTHTMYAHTHVCTHTCMHTRTYAHTHVCTHTHAHTHVCTHARMHAHTLHTHLDCGNDLPDSAEVPMLLTPLVPVTLWVKTDDSIPTGCLDNMVTDSEGFRAPITDGRWVEASGAGKDGRLELSDPYRNGI